MSVTNLVVAVRTTGANQLNRIGARMNALAANVRRATANMRVAWNRFGNNLIARGGITGVLSQWAQAGAQAAARFGSALSNAMPAALQGLPPQIQAAIVAAGVTAAAILAPMIGAALAAGVLLAVGGGVLAAGIVAAVKDPAVSGAFKALGERAKTALSGFAEPFKAPLIRAADTFGASLERMAPTLKAMGAAVAPLIDKLAPGLAGMAEKMLPGLQKAAQAAIPLFEKLAEHLPKLGESMGRFFESVANGAPGALKFLDLFLVWAGFLIESMGNAIEFLSASFSGLASFVSAAFRIMVNAVLGTLGLIVMGAAAAFSWVPGLGPKLAAAAVEFRNFTARVNAALDGIQDETVNINVRLIKQAGVPGLTGSNEQFNVSVGRRAKGGPVRAGQSYIVGEEGPEVITPTRSGYVHPNGSGGSAVSSGASGARWTGPMSGLEAMFFTFLQESIRKGKLRLA